MPFPTRLSLVVLALAAAVVTLPSQPAEAACRPITISDLPPLPSPDPAPVVEGEPPPEPPPPPPRSCFVYRMLWPVLGGETGSSFGSPRDGGARRHLGVDIFAPKLTPVVAAADGVVVEAHGRGGECCWVKIRHDDGWFSVYVHLNNDTAGTDDGRGAGLRPGIEAGRRVVAGEVLGWLGGFRQCRDRLPSSPFRAADAQRGPNRSVAKPAVGAA